MTSDFVEPYYCSAKADEAEDEPDHDEDVFRPEVGNVAFGSAYDGWAFRVDQFADMYAEKLGCKAQALCRFLWGDWSFSSKERRVVKAKRCGSDTPLKQMFVQFALEPIWKVRSKFSYQYFFTSKVNIDRHLGRIISLEIIPDCKCSTIPYQPSLPKLLCSLKQCLFMALCPFSCILTS